MPTPIATLGGFPLLNSSTVRWSSREGVRPSIETFDMIPKDAETLLASPTRPLDLVMEANGERVVFKYLYILHAAPQDQPQIAKVTVADRRWLWPNTHILRRYNMRRNIGVKRVTNYDVPELAQVIPTVWYWPWSLKTSAAAGAAGAASAGVPWLARDVLADVIGEVLEVERGWNGQIARVVDHIGQAANQTPIENLELSDGGDAALTRVLNYLPAVGIKLSPEGDVTFYRKTDGGEKAMVQTLGPETVGDGHVTLVSNRVLRPRKCIVLVQREIETRFDYTESPTSGTAALPGADTRYLENVGQVTDASLTVTSGMPGATECAEGTWLTIDQFFATWDTLRGITWSGGNGHSIVQKSFVPFGPSLWEMLEDRGQKDAATLWPPRIAMLQRCYRQVFRINPRWMARILSLRAYRVAPVDQATGTRAPAAVYADHAIIPSDRSIFGRTVDEQYFAVNVSAYADNRPAPATLEIVDADQGIIAINYKLDPLRLNEMILPSKIENPPNGDIRFPLRQPLSFDSVCAGVARPKLSSSFTLSVIMTAIPASPNTDQQLHRIEITPEQAQPLIGSEIGPCEGPDMEIFVGPNVVTAKVRWSDDAAVEIEKCFGLTPGTPNLTNLLLNDGPSSPTTGASLNNVAQAVAAQLYAALLDRPQGTQGGHLNPDVKLAGYMDEVSHEIRPDAASITRISLPGRVPRLTLATYLDSSTRNAIYRLAQPPGAA